MMRRYKAGSLLMALTLLVALATAASAQAVRAGFNSDELGPNDDGSVGSAIDVSTVLGVPSINFFGLVETDFYLNNNGNITFDSTYSGYTPSSIATPGQPLIAPFYADVDTRGALSGTLRYGTGTVDGKSAWGATWGYTPAGGVASALDGVGYYGAHDDLLNVFQLVLIDRSDIAAGDFDFEFNYNQILWETGDASSGVGGFGGFPARAGYTNGTVGYPDTYELPGSGVSMALIDSNLTTGLIHHSLNSTVPGRYLFTVRGGIVVDPNVPEPGALAFLAAGITSAIGLVTRRRRK